MKKLFSPAVRNLHFDQKNVKKTNKNLRFFASNSVRGSVWASIEFQSFLNFAYINEGETIEKNDLPAFVASVNLEEGARRLVKNIKSFSGFIQIDIDKKDNLKLFEEKTPAEIASFLLNIDELRDSFLFIIESPSGGLKGVLKCPVFDNITEFKQYYNNNVVGFFDSIKIVLDKSLNDPVKACFLPNKPFLYVSESDLKDFTAPDFDSFVKSDIVSGLNFSKEEKSAIIYNFSKEEKTILKKFNISKVENIFSRLIEFEFGFTNYEEYRNAIFAGSSIEDEATRENVKNILFDGWKNTPKFDAENFSLLWNNSEKNDIKNKYSVGALVYDLKKIGLSLNNSEAWSKYINLVFDEKKGILKDIEFVNVKELETLFNNLGVRRSKEKSNFFIMPKNNIIDFEEEFTSGQIYDYIFTDILGAPAEVVELIAKKKRLFTDLISSDFSIFDKIADKLEIILNENEKIVFSEEEKKFFICAVDKPVFKGTILNVDSFDILPEKFAPDLDSPFEEFIFKACGQTEKDFEYILNALGYLIDPAPAPRVVLLMDKNVGNEGGTGKGIIAESLKWFIGGELINGKSFNPLKVDFTFSNCTRSTRLVVIDDLIKNFSIESMYSIITNGLEVNKKFKQPFVIYPKFLMTTNSAIKIEGESDRRRMHPIVLSDFFNASAGVIPSEKVFLLNKKFDKKSAIRFFLKAYAYYVYCGKTLLKPTEKATEKINLAVLDEDTFEVINKIVNNLIKQNFDLRSNGFIKCTELSNITAKALNESKIFSYHITPNTAGGKLGHYFKQTNKAIKKTIKSGDEIIKAWSFDRSIFSEAEFENEPF